MFRLWLPNESSYNEKKPKDGNMNDTFTSFFLTVFLIEAGLIVREMRKASLEKKWKERANLLAAETSELKASLDQAQRDLEGINYLWKKSLLTEKNLRKDLDIAKVQLTYLASKVVNVSGIAKSDVQPQEDLGNIESRTYWTSDKEQTSSSHEAADPKIDYAINSTFIV